TSSRELLLHTVRSVLSGPDDFQVADLEIDSPFNEKEYSEDKLSVVDIKARDPRGRQFNIEMHLAIHLVELPKFSLSLEELKTPLEAWCWFLRHAASLDNEHLPVQLNLIPIQRAVEVLTMLTEDHVERRRYEER